MAKSRMEKNKKLYDDLDNEMKNNKGDLYEEKLKAIDPNIDNDDIGMENTPVSGGNLVKKNETKNASALTVIAKEVNGEKAKKNEVVPVKNKKEEKKQIEENFEDYFENPISYTDKLSVEEILRAKLEQQEKLRSDKRGMKKGPNDETYTPEMMQKRIKQHEGVNVRKEAKIVTKDYRWVALMLLVISLISVLVIGALLIFKVIKI